MNPNFFGAARELGWNAAVVALLIAGVLTGIALLGQAIAGWFDDRNS
jgi:hypothetical protein